MYFLALFDSNEQFNYDLGDDFLRALVLNGLLDLLFLNSPKTFVAQRYPLFDLILKIQNITLVYQNNDSKNDKAIR
jgi:hypothetical protein